MFDDILLRFENTKIAGIFVGMFLSARKPYLTALPVGLES
jgi:hypothetical protein